jgi:hypothetical protein
MPEPGAWPLTRRSLIATSAAAPIRAGSIGAGAQPMPAAPAPVPVALRWTGWNR